MQNNCYDIKNKTNQLFFYSIIKYMEAGEPSRKKNTPRQIIIEILGTAIALTTLTLPILLITNFSKSSPPNSTPSNSVSIP